MGDRHQHWQAGIERIREARASVSEQTRRYYEVVNRRCLAQLGIAGDVLDVGCGDGSMRRSLGNVRSYVGIDLPPVPESSPDAAFVEGSAEALPFDDESFDAVLCYSVLQHIENPALALSEMRRVLRPTGRLALQVVVEDGNPIFVNHWRADDIVKVLCGVGFAVERFTVVRVDGGWDAGYFVAMARKA